MSASNSWCNCTCACIWSSSSSSQVIPQVPRAVEPSSVEHSLGEEIASKEEAVKAPSPMMLREKADEPKLKEAFSPKKEHRSGVLLRSNSITPPLRSTGITPTESSRLTSDRSTDSVNVSIVTLKAKISSRLAPNIEWTMDNRPIFKTIFDYAFGLIDEIHVLSWWEIRQEEENLPQTVQTYVERAIRRLGEMSLSALIPNSGTLEFITTHLDPKELFLQATFLTDSDFAFFSNAKNLEGLVLENCITLQPEALHHLDGCQKLKRIQLHHAEQFILQTETDQKKYVEAGAVPVLVIKKTVRNLTIKAQRYISSLFKILPLLKTFECNGLRTTRITPVSSDSDLSNRAINAIILDPHGILADRHEGMGSPSCSDSDGLE